jgi:hypothetical protein
MATTIKKRQIEDGAIDDAKVQAGAAIASSKLADGSNFTKKDGTVAFTGNQSMGGNKLTNHGTPSTGTDVANKDYVDTQIANLNSTFKMKPNVRAATTGNITLSNPGTAVFDGVTLATSELLLVRAQSVANQNGIYMFNGSGVALTRIASMDIWAEVPGAVTTVDEGSTYADTMWLCSANAGGTLGTTSIDWTQIPTAAGLVSANFVTRETPTGLINGSNTAFSLANTPVAGTEMVFLNGILQEVGGGNDYTISGASITMIVAPLTGEKLVVTYRK